MWAEHLQTQTAAAEKLSGGRLSGMGIFSARASGEDPSSATASGSGAGEEGSGAATSDKTTNSKKSLFGGLRKPGRGSSDDVTGVEEEAGESKSKEKKKVRAVRRPSATRGGSGGSVSPARQKAGGDHPPVER